MKKIKFIDLFAGLGGTRLGLEKALEENGLLGECVFTSEIKPHAVKAYKHNFHEKIIHGDITKIKVKEIPDFDILLAGFPCQPFSSAGSRKGFGDTRGTLFFEIERILKTKRPTGFLLENVEGLVNHDKYDNKKPIGKTLETILHHLQSLGYLVSWKVIDSSDVGTPQKRRRIYILGTKNVNVNLDDLPQKESKLKDILCTNNQEFEFISTDFTKKLFSHYKVNELYGKHIKDKRGGNNNIHSWNIGLKGEVTQDQKKLLEEMLKQRRRKHWAKNKPFKWSDGMPLTLSEIKSFFNLNLPIFGDKEPKDYLEHILEDLVQKGYLVKEKPKGSPPDYEKGYNIVSGKLSFEISQILDPDKPTPTLVATDVTKLAVVEGNKLRRLTIREGLRLFGFPENYNLEGIVNYRDAYDLLGNSVCVDVIRIVSSRLLKAVVS